MTWLTLGRPAGLDDGPDPLEDPTMPPLVRLARVMEYWRVDRRQAAFLIAQQDAPANGDTRLID